MEHRVRELALFNLGIDSKLRGCDLVALKVRDVSHGDQLATRAIVMQHKTQRPVQFEITPATREALQAWIKQAQLKADDFLFPSRLHESPHLGTRQYARILGHCADFSDRGRRFQRDRGRRFSVIVDDHGSARVKGFIVSQSSTATLRC
jgi:integrase